MSIYKAETRRLLKRRFTKFLVIGAVVVLAAVAVGVFLTNQKIGPAQIAAAQAEADRSYQEQLGFATEERTRCEQAKGTADAGNYPPDCAGITGPQREEINYEWFMPATFDFRKNFGDMVTAMAAILALVAFVIGASYVGAEWNSGGMMNLLLWRPQRLKVLGTKLSALLVGLTALTTVVAAAWTGLFLLIAQLRGTSASMTAGAWQSYLLMEVRALVLVLAAGALGFGLASLGRHTALALGAAIGVVVLFQFGLGVVLSLANVKFVEAFLVPIWVQAWMIKKVTIQDFNSCDYSGFSNSCEPDKLDITWQMSGGLMTAVVVLVLVAALWSMRRRDVT